MKPFYLHPIIYELKKYKPTDNLPIKKQTKQLVVYFKKKPNENNCTF